MGRPKGSKNKKKADDVKFEKKSDVMPPVKMEAATKWNPEPDMGDIKPPEEAEKVCACQHKGKTHYGGPKGWCNVGGCNCQEFKN